MPFRLACWGIWESNVNYELCSRWSLPFYLAAMLNGTLVHREDAARFEVHPNAADDVRKGIVQRGLQFLFFVQLWADQRCTCTL